MYYIESEFTHMTLQFGLLVPQGWRMDLVGITDPVEAYETMTRVAQEAEALGYDSIWLFDHFHTVPVPTQEVIDPIAESIEQGRRTAGRLSPR